MNKLDDLIQKLCPDGVEYKPLSEIFNTRNGYTPSKKEKNFWENGTVPWFRMEDIRENGGILDHAMQYVSINAIKGDPFPENSIIVATSATIGEHALITVPSIANQRFTYLMAKEQYKDDYDPKFLYYYCFKLDEYCKECLNQGNFASVDMKKFAKFQFPRLPMEIQREIVGVLDNYTEVTAKIKVSLEKELVARQKQYEFYRDKLLTFDVLRGGTIDFRWRMLCEIADISTGNSNTNEAVEDGKYPFFVRSQEPLRKNDFEYDEAAIITAGDGVGVGKVYHYIEGKYALHQRAYRIHINTSEVVPKYYFHYMKAKFLPYIQKTMFQGSVASIRRPMLNAFPVPVPPLDVQDRIVNVLDNFEKICSDLNIGLPAEIEARQKQYEYYRDKLLTFAEIGNTILSRAEQSRAEQSRAEQSRALIKLLQYVFGYAVVTLEDIAENCDSMRKPVTSGKREAGEYPYYGASGIVDYVKDYIFDGDYLLVSEDGANLLARSTPIAFSISGKNWVNNHAHVLKFDCYETRRFIEFYLNSIDLSSYISGGAQPKLNQKNLNRIEIPLPSQERQKYIVEILDRFDTICNDLTSGLPAEIEARQKQYEYYRDKLLTFKEVAAT
jgi:type I restriction enzyme S subunit